MLDPPSEVIPVPIATTRILTAPSSENSYPSIAILLGRRIFSPKPALHLSPLDMSGEPSIPPAPISAASSTSSLWDRLTQFASRHRRTIIYTTVTATFIIGAGGIWYYVQQQQGDKGQDAEGKRKREKTSNKKKAKKQPAVNDEEKQVGQTTNGVCSVIGDLS